MSMGENVSVNRKYAPSLDLPFTELTADDARFLFNKIKKENKNRKDRYDPRQFRGAGYWERGFLSCVMAGAKIPDVITPDHFRMPWNKIIFEALRLIRLDPAKTGMFEKYDLLVAFLSQNPHFDQNFKDYVTGIRDMVGVPSAVYAFAERLLMLKAGIDV